MDTSDKLEPAIIDHFPTRIVKHEMQGNVLTFADESDTSLRIYILQDSVIRVRYAVSGYFIDDFSYAVSDKYKPKNPDFQFKEQEHFYEIKTSTLICYVMKEDMQVKFHDSEDRLINQDEKGFHWEEHPKYGGEIVQMTKEVQPEEHYFGLGDKPTNLNLRGKRLQLWGTDEYGYKRDTDPLYKNIPFYMGLHAGIGYGIFFDNTFRSFFDFASERKNATSFWADGGEMNYYFIYGPSLLDVVRRYTILTGTPEMPPLWSLGYHQCKWSYYPESQVREVADKLRDLKIPCDAIYLDIDYMHGFRCFTWDKEKFPDPKGMVDDLKKQGFRTIVIIDPGIKIDKEYSVFKEALDNDYFCRRADGPFMKGKVWPGDCYFPDFTRPEVREWWAGLYKELIGEIGVEGVWNDMNEPAVFEVEGKTFPDDVRHDFDGHPCSHRKAHNVYGMQMARASYDGVKKYMAPGRPFLITRSCFAGSQRYSSVWTGDNLATWDHLSLANIQCQRLSISGISFVGSDIGGFIDHPTSELYVRWMQLAVFHPFFRTHSSGDHGNQEPWSFGKEALNIVRKFIELRYQLLPYLYTAFHQYVTEGTPMLRPLAFTNQNDELSVQREDEFMVGDHILVCPVLSSNITSSQVYLPKGTWYQFWTDELFDGEQESAVECPLEESLIFLRGGSVISMGESMQFVGEKPEAPLTLHVYYTEGKLESKLYLDAGDGYEYEAGEYLVNTFNLTGEPSRLTLTQKSEGSFKPAFAEYEIHFHGLPGQPKHDSDLTFKEKKVKERDVFVLRADVNFEEIIIDLAEENQEE